jgi:hypothetical protein
VVVLPEARDCVVRLGAVCYCNTQLAGGRLFAKREIPLCCISGRFFIGSLETRERDVSVPVLFLFETSWAEIIGLKARCPDWVLRPYRSPARKMSDSGTSN